MRRAHGPVGATLAAIIVCAIASCGRLGYDRLPQPDAAPGGAGGFVGAAGMDGGAGTAGAGGMEGGFDAGSEDGSEDGLEDGSEDSFDGAAGQGGMTGGTGGGDAGVAGEAGAGDGAAITCLSASHAGHEYQFCDAVVDWPAARGECERRGLRLVRIDDEAENSWLVTTATSGPISFQKSRNLWMGAHEPAADGDWRWTDGAPFWLGDQTGGPVNGLYSNWNRGEPDNATGPESCVAIPLNGTTWIDDGCGRLQYFVCEDYP